MPKFFKTIRWKLTLSFLLTFGIMIIVFSVIIYNIEEFQYRKSVDNAMNVLAVSIYEEMQPDGIKPEIFDETRETYIPFTSVSQHYAEITDSAGNVIIKNNQLGNSVIPIKAEHLYASVKGIKQIFSIKEMEGNGLWDSYGVRVLYFPVKYKGSNYFIIIGVPKTNLESSLYNLRLIYLISISLMLIISSFIGWFFSKKAYAPVKHLIENANQITAENLSKRLPVNEAGDELAQLSVTLNKMIERLENSFYSLKQFTSDASHELRTPLTILRGQIEVTLEKERSSEEYRKNLKDNLDEAIRLQSIVDELLLLSQLDSGKMEISNEQINVCELLTEVAAKSNFLAAKKNIKIILNFNLDENINSDQLMVTGDPATLLNVFLNIFENAVKYSPDNSEIICSLKHNPVNKNLEIVIKDQGIGISEDNLKKIFKRFYRVDSARTRDSSISLGLGLPIAKKVIELMNGTISVQSKLSAGTTIIISLPSI